MEESRVQERNCMWCRVVWWGEPGTWPGCSWEASMQFRPRLLLAGSLAGALILTAACGGDDGNDTTPTTGPMDTPTTQASPTPPATGETPTTPASTISPTTGPSTTPAATTTPSGPAVCATGDLDVALVNGGGAAGTHFQVINLTNEGDSDCVIEGYPGLSLVDAAGTQVGPAAERNDAIPTEAIVLAPGESAHAMAGFPNWQNFDEGVCAAESTDLKIFPPGEFEAILLPYEDRACPGFSVRAFEPGLGTGTGS